MKPRQWYRFQNNADDPSVAELFIYDDIGQSWWDDNAVTAKNFMEDLKALSSTVSKIVVRVNSLGGDVFEAVAIANALRDQTSKGRAVETVVDGIAASAASIVIMAGSTIRIADNALVMIHNPYTIALGNAGELRKTAEALDKIRDTIVATYKWHSSLEADALIGLIDAETWMDADEAIANGFATEKVEGLKAAASLNPRSLGKLAVPEKFKAKVAGFLKKEDPAPVAANASDILSAVDAAGLGTGFARELVAAALPMDQVTARIEKAKNDRVAAEARATDIRAACATAKQPELADGYINGGMNIAAVKAHLVTITAKIDKTEIDASLGPDGGTTTKKAAINASAIYAERNSTKK